MKCPACGNTMTKKTIAGVGLDVCEGGCGGVWFDWFELQKFDESHEHAGEELLNVARDESVIVDHEARRNCPRCQDIVMMRHFFSPKMEVEVDECPKCGGFWLDPGELRSIRDQFENEAARDDAARDYFSELFDGELRKMRTESQEKLGKSRSIARLLRFLCPSYYLPGKQSWGAH